MCVRQFRAIVVLARNCLASTLDYIIMQRGKGLLFMYILTAQANSHPEYAPSNKLNSDRAPQTDISVAVWILTILDVR